MKQDERLPKAIICDLDGTLCLFGNKSPYERDFINDECNQVVKSIIENYLNTSTTAWGAYTKDVILFSGRDSKHRNETEKWLKNNGIHYRFLEMRKSGDQRKDSIVKREMFDEFIKDKYYVDFVLDDRNQVVELWRSLGLTCLQVADGNF